MRAGQSNITRDSNRFQHRGRLPKASTMVQERQGESLGQLHMAHGAQGAGPTRRRQAGTSGVRNVEIVTIDESESDDETLEEMEAELVRMIQRRLGRKRSHQGKNNAF